MNVTDWKPGDVAMVRFGGGDIEPAILTNTGRWYSLLDGCWDSGGMEPIRPLVVIDPESAEDVKRLADLYWDAFYEAGHHGGRLAAALREFAAPTPPKPAEPTGLGAVVVAGDGDRWTRTTPRIADFNWIHEDGERTRPWRHLDVVRVLSEGIQ